MKKIFILPLFITMLLVSSCNQEADPSLDPRPLLVNGQFMRLDIQKDRLDATDLQNTSFGGPLTNPSGTVVRFEMFVRVSRAGDLISDYLLYDKIYSFPYELSVTPASIEAVYAREGIPLTLRNADKIRFVTFSYDSSENKVGYTNLSRTVQTEAGYKQAYRFNLQVTDQLEAPVNNYEAN